jgi:hypothetical protein
MNTTRLKIKSLLFITFLLLTGYVHASDVEANQKNKEINQTFSATNNDQLRIDNRYGNITITYWNKNEVSIRVVIEANARTDKRAQELIDRTTINMGKSGNTISAQTNLKSFNTSNNERLSINYYVSMPSKMTSSLLQRYGNIYLPDRNEAKIKLEAHYGNIFGGDFTGDLTLESKYGNIEIGNTANMEMDLSYCGKVITKNGNSVRIESSYSNLNMGDITTFALKGKYGGNKVGKVNEATIELNYSNITFISIQNGIKAETLNYSTLTIEELNPEFKHFRANARYGNVNINISSKAEFQVIAENMRYGDFTLTGFKADQRKENNNFYSTVNNGNRDRLIRFDGGNYSNLRIQSL